MNCPLCLHPDTMVMRTTEAETGIKRTRQCKRCGHRWPTMEIELRRVTRLQRLEEAAREALTER